MDNKNIKTRSRRSPEGVPAHDNNATQHPVGGGGQDAPTGQPGSGRICGDIAAGMSQAAAILGTSRAVVREAKKLGCLAFRANNNVHVPTLKKWLAENQIELDESEAKHISEGRYLRAKADRMEIIVKTQNKTLIPVDVMRRTFAASVVSAKTRLLSIPDNLCQRLAAMNEPIAIRELLRKSLNEALDELSKCKYADPVEKEKAA